MTTPKESIADKLRVGGDLRSIGQVNDIIENIDNQAKFDELFKCLFHKERIIIMRAADAIEKITIKNPLFLKKHKKAIFGLCDTAYNKELKWHLALLIPRLELSKEELSKTWNALTRWAKDKTNSRIVRVNSIEGLFELLKKEGERKQDYELTLLELEEEDIPSLSARIKSIKKQKLSND
jgi:activator of HSP90 ATPase